MADPSAGLNLKKWHQRYLQQAHWTQAIRQNLFAKAGLSAGDRVLEVGSGTGAVLSQLAAEAQYRLAGIDLDHRSLLFAQEEDESFDLAQADGHWLPFADGTFAATCCHYVLLWVKDPARVLAELHRVTRPGGCVIALAEPDHAARIDYPPPLDQLGELQTKSLREQGANIAMGRKLSMLFRQSGLENIETGILSAEWTGETSAKPDQTEWMTIRSDLQQALSEPELSRYEDVDRIARERGIRVLFIPTFYAIGFVL
jgi:ubiquinone/menaquinone biosynthesis C-methylase UbiE